MAKKNKRTKTATQQTGTATEMGEKHPLRLVVFDLDYTIWQPEMYQLYGAPTLTSVDSKYNKRLSEEILNEARTNQDGFILTDRRNTPMRVFPGA